MAIDLSSGDMATIGIVLLFCIRYLLHRHRAYRRTNTALVIACALSDMLVITAVALALYAVANVYHAVILVILIFAISMREWLLSALIRALPLAARLEAKARKISDPDIKNRGTHRNER